MYLPQLSREKLLKLFGNIIDHSYQSGGPMLSKLQDLVWQQTGQKALATSSCGSALFAMYSVLKPRVVICASNTFYATASMAKQAGAELLLVDCNREDFSMSYDSLVKMTQSLPDVIAAGRLIVTLTHVGGNLAKDYEKIAKHCEELGIILIEDAAHAYGASRRTEEGTTIRAGSLSYAACFSFFPTKAIPVGELGLITSDNHGFIAECGNFINYGKTHDKTTTYFNHDTPGFNLRPDEWSCAVAYVQIERIDEILANRLKIIERLKMFGMELLVDIGPDDVSNWYKAIVPLSHPLARNRMTAKLYSISDQVATIEGLPLRNYPNTLWVTENHACISLNEATAFYPDAEFIGYYFNEPLKIINNRAKYYSQAGLVMPE